MKNTNVLGSKVTEEMAFEQFMAGGITIEKRLPLGDHKALFKGLVMDVPSQTITIQFEVEGEIYNDRRKFKSDKLASLEITLKQLGQQLELQGNIPLADFNKALDHEIIVFARIPEGYKTVFYNYQEPFAATKSETKAETVVEGKDF